MIFGTYGELAFAELPEEYDRSVVSQFQSLLDNPNTQFIYLVHLYPYDPKLAGILKDDAPYGATAIGEFEMPYSGGVTSVFISDAGYTTKPNDSLANRHFSALVDNPYQFEISIMNGSDFGSGSPSFGSITIASENGAQDYLNDYYWGARRVNVKVGTRNQPYDQFTSIFDGLVNGIEADDERITLTISDNRAKVDGDIKVSQYIGSGGLDGASDNVGKPKPLCYGEVKNIEPVLIDPTNLIYQVHDGSILSIDKLRDAGVELINDGDVSDIMAATVGAGKYKTQLSGGYIKLGSSASGLITADVKGDNSGGYINTIGGIAQRIVKSRLGIVSLSNTDIDGGAFNRLDNSVSGAAGIYISDIVSGSNLLDTLINSVLAYWTFDRSGILTCGIIDTPNTENSYITIDDIEESGVQVLEEITPSWRVKVGYCPLGMVQAASELAGSVSETDRAFYSTEYRFVSSEDSNVYTSNPKATERTFYTRLINQSDASILATRLMSVYAINRKKLKVPLVGNLFKYFVGQTVRITYPRHGLKNGKNMIITGISEDAETNTTTLELWG